MKKDKDLIYLPRTPESVPTPRTRKTAIHTSEAHIVTKPKHFERALSKLNERGVLDRQDFSSAADLGAFIDFYNDANTTKKEKHARNEIVEIAKFLARTATSKTFVGKGKAKDSG